MLTPGFVVLLAASVVLVVEFLMTAGAGLMAYGPGLERFAHLTGFTPSATVYRGLGALALAGVAGIIAGIWWPPAAIVAAVYFALLSGFTLARQLGRGQRGSELIPYTLFLLCALIVIVVRAW